MEEFLMDKKSTGPYQHYERPTEKRSSQDSQPSGSARWIAVIIILAVILIALIPVVHRLASSHSFLLFHLRYLHFGLNKS